MLTPRRSIPGEVVSPSAIADESFGKVV